MAVGAWPWSPRWWRWCSAASPPPPSPAPGSSGRESISFLIILPIALPGIITGIALRSAITVSEFPFGMTILVAGHATFCVVVVYNNVLARLYRTSGSVVEASKDLGASGFQTFRYVLLPTVGTALLAGGMLAFALSFDEIIVTTFTAGNQQTLPIWIFRASTGRGTGRSCTSWRWSWWW